MFTIPATFRARLEELVTKFDRHRDQYLKASYNESQARVDFIDPLFEALGWDVRNRAGHGLTEREVIVESGRTQGRPDYNFRVEGQTKFFVEAKAPHVPLDRTDVIMQAKSYAWNTRDVFVAAVTDFEEFRLYDASLKPDRKHPDAGLIFAPRYTEYLSPEGLAHLWELSREAVCAGSLERLLKLTAKEKRQRIPVDQAFLADLTAWREQLAKAVYKAQPGMDAADLNSAVQVFLDRLIFIRIAEDRGVLPPRGLKEIVEAWEYSGKRRPLNDDLNALFREVNDRLNGEIFKPHHSEKIVWDAPLVAGIIAGLYYPACPYLFDVIGVELLGSIYERYLGKTIRVTEKRAIVEDKPEVRKAGGVYYTLKYIVDYIVAQTVGKLIEGKTPAQIAKLKILDPACGSGSFLLGAYQCLLDYHLKWYAEHDGRQRTADDRQMTLIADAESGEVRLTLAQKAEILRNNLYGVDIDPQAVEITMMSLYIKMLEGERGALVGQSVLPRLSDNIKCGNSLISTLAPTPSPSPVGKSTDRGGGPAPSPATKSRGRAGVGAAARQLSLLLSADLSHLRPFDWESERDGFGAIMKAGGFDAVIGNPPYIRIQNLQETSPEQVAYLKQNYRAASSGNYDIYVVFVEKGLGLLNRHGRLGFILPSKFFATDYGQGLRQLIAERKALAQVVDFGHAQIFEEATTYTCLLFLEGAPSRSVAYAKIDTPPMLATNLVEYQPLDIETFTAEPWMFSTDTEKRLAEKITQNAMPLGDLARIGRGSSSGDDEVFILHQAGKKLTTRQGDQVAIEAGILRVPIYATDFGRYLFDPKSDEVIIFPYNVTSDGYELKSASELQRQFPKAYKYLASRRRELEARKQFKAWYGFSAPRNLDVHEAAQMLVPLLADKGLYCRLPKEAIGYCLMASGGFSITVSAESKLSPNYVLGLLNSKLLFWRLRSISNIFRGGWITCTKQYVETLPIRPINFSDPADKARHDRVAALVERMLELHKRKAEAKSETLRAQLEREINVTDEKIDALVYELYGLTEEEVRVVEGRA